MRAFHTRAACFAGALLMAAAVSAQAQGLERVGPTSPSNGFPTWYQDTTGLALEFCQPLNQAELDGGWCLLLAGDTTVPESFPSPFSNEHFYWAANAAINAPSVNALLVVALEGAFAAGPVVNGDQVVFARIRIRFDAPATGSYTVYHPYGTEVISATAGERVFYTEDIGIACPGTFDCALRGRIGPFLLASNTPGGAELAAIAGPVPGKLYIADPARLGPVTGSPLNQNFFRIVGPAGTTLGETFDFSLAGRVYQDAMGGRMTVDRAKYARNAGSIQGKLDVFATAFATAQPRLPGAPVTGAVTPLLGFYPAPCSVGAGGALGAPAGVTAVQMFSAGSRYYGQLVGDIPTAVCVQDYTARDPNGQAIASFAQTRVVDQVTITQALYDPAGGGTLTISATSSDANTPPTLTAGDFGVLASGNVVAIVGVPPVMAAVSSSAGGRAELEVSTLEGQPSFPALPLAGNDAYTLAEDSGLLGMAVLANDTVAGVLIPDTTPAAITIGQAPALGTAVVNGRGIDYTPNPNANGSDLLTYTVTVNGVVSPPALVSITITPVNDPPVAINDTASGIGGLAISVPLLANDIDVDGAADLAGANIVTAPAGIPYTVVGGALSFSAPAGTYTFTYQARDAAGALSNIATVTVTLSGGETLAITRAEFISNKRRWRVDGTSSVLGSQTVYVMYANGTFINGATAVGYLVGTTQVDPATGLWLLDLTLAGSNDPRVPNGTQFGVRPTAIYAITSLGGSSPVTAFAIK